MHKFLFVIVYMLSLQVFAEAHCTSSSIDDCPAIYHEKCEHVECVKHKCKCYVPGDEDYHFGKNYHPSLF